MSLLFCCDVEIHLFEALEAAISGVHCHFDRTAYYLVTVDSLSPETSIKAVLISFYRRVYNLKFVYRFRSGFKVIILLFMSSQVS